MATRIFSSFDTTPTNVVADIKTAILTSDAWSNPASQRVVAQTTRGADMVVDLADAAATAIRMTLGVYRTTGLSDKINRYLSWRASGGATSDPLHVMVSAGKEHLFISINGPHTGEANAEAIPARCGFFIGDMAPYLASDSVAAVVVAGDATTSLTSTTTAAVSRNAANNASWVTARLATLAYSNADSASTQPLLPVTVAADGNTYVWPYVVFESTAGIRGRITEAFFVGWSGMAVSGPGELSRLSLGGNPYIVVRPVWEGNRNFPFGVFTAANALLVAIPHA